MKKSILGGAALALALALTGCGSDTKNVAEVPDIDNNPDESVLAAKTITAVDGYLENAQVSVDTNNNFMYDSEDLVLGRTVELGKFVVPAEHSASTIFVTAIANETTDTSRGIVTESFSLGMTGEDTVASPITNLVTELLSKDSGLDVSGAKALVVESFEGLEDSTELLFSDYLADDSEVAVAINILGELLVDNKDLTTEQKLQVAVALSDNFQAEIDNSDEVLSGDYSPAIIIPDNPSQAISVVSNYKPLVSGSLDSVTMALADSFTAIDLTSLFTDGVESAALTFSLSESNGLANGLSIDSDGVLSGELTSAGQYSFEIVATDAYGLSSDLLVFSVVVENAGNDLPVVSTVAQGLVQAEIDTWWLEDQSVIDYSFSLVGLFEDNDDLSYRVTSSLDVDTNGDATGFYSIVNALSTGVYFNRAPMRVADAGVESITVWASDGVNSQEVSVIFTLPAILEKVVVDPVDPEAPLGTMADIEDTMWYYAGMGQGNARCITVYFDSADKVMYSGTTEYGSVGVCDTDVDRTTGVSYSIDDDGILKSDNYDTDGISYTEIFDRTGIEVAVVDELNVTATRQIVGFDYFEEVLIRLTTDAAEVESLLLNDIDGEKVYAEFLVASNADSASGELLHWFAASLSEEVVGGQTVTTATLASVGAESCGLLETVYGNTFYVISDNGLELSPTPTLVMSKDEADRDVCDLVLTSIDSPLPESIITITNIPSADSIKIDSRLVFSFDNRP